MKLFEPKLSMVGTPQGRAFCRVCEGSQFDLWLQQARPGARMVYATAFWLPKPKVAAVLDRIRGAYDAGLIELVQERGIDGAPYRYLAVRRALTQRPTDAFTPRFQTPPQQVRGHAAGAGVRQISASELFGKRGMAPARNSGAERKAK